MPDATPCSHLAEIDEVEGTEASECAECVETGSRWVHLRTCQRCGRTHCCDSSPNRHATARFRATDHPVVASAEPGERWLYCYPDDYFARY